MSKITNGNNSEENPKHISSEKSLIQELMELTRKNEETIKTLTKKVETLEKALGYQQCFTHVNKRVTEELKLQLDGFQQNKEEKLVFTGAKVNVNETGESLKQEIINLINEK